MKALLALLCALSAGGAVAECRQALALGLDVSGSVDGQEYALQRDGLAAAFEAPEVAAALLSGGAPVAVSIYEWSEPDYQRVLIPWQILPDAQALRDLTTTLRGVTRSPAPTGTALGSALSYGADLLRAAPDCPIRTLDISGDGKSIAGPRPESPSVRAALAGITVNALVIAADDRGPQDNRSVDVAELSSYFRAFVIHGPDAFVQVALGYADYEAAMTRKLLREIRVIVLGDAAQGGSAAANEALLTAKNAQALAHATDRFNFQ